MAVSSLFLSGAAIAASFFLSGADAGKSSYSLETEYSGAGFFDGFDFFTEPDPTFGFVDYVDNATAWDKGYISASDDGPAWIGVDFENTLDVNGPGRESVRIQTKKAWTHGLFILDLSNMPGGACGTWPAWWSYGPSWPQGGAMDIIEGANSATTNTLSLQTAPDCSINGLEQTATIHNYNCDEAANGGVGCGSVATQANNYGLGFNANGGGVYATEWTSQYIKTWFFPRNSIPKDITKGSPDPTGWGTPDANFQGSCDIDSHFYDNQFVLNTDFCGQWASTVWDSDETCSKLAKTCEEYVAGNPSAFVGMYWEINSLKVYTNGDSTIFSATSTAAAPTSTSSIPIPTSTSMLPKCGQTCFSNMINAYSGLGCSGPDAACLCQKPDFFNGIRDCSEGACGDPTVAAIVIDFNEEWCSAATATLSTSATPTPTAISMLPACGQTCMNNMINSYTSLGCSGPDPACLCQQPNFFNGIHDCSEGACGNPAVAAEVIAFGQYWCATGTSSSSAVVTSTTSSVKSSSAVATSTASSVKPSSSKAVASSTAATTSTTPGSSPTSEEGAPSSTAAASSSAATSTAAVSSSASPSDSGDGAASSSSSETAATSTTSATASSSPTSTSAISEPTSVGTFQYVGCYSSDDAFGTFLQEGASANNTLESCTQKCASVGDKYAGIWGQFCYCASTFDEDNLVPMPESSCNLPCPGDASEICGGGVAATKRGISSNFLAVYANSGAASNSSASSSSSAFPSSSSTSAVSSSPSSSAIVSASPSSSAIVSAPYGNSSFPSSTSSAVVVISTATVIPVQSTTSTHSHKHHHHGNATSSYTTSTVYATSVYTITSCAATVTDCPARIGQVTTETIALYTTVCPVTATQTSAPHAHQSHHSSVEYTVSTVYATSIYTITSCAATVTDCPARIGKETTEIISLYTTVCPVTEAHVTTPAAVGGSVSTAAAASVWSYKYGGGNSTTISATGAAATKTTSFVTANGASAVVLGKGMGMLMAVVGGLLLL